MAGHTRGVPTSRLVLGTTVIIIGVLLTLDNLEIIRVGNVLRYWPVIVVAFGMAVLLESGRLPGVVSGAVVMAAGALLLLGNIGVLRFHLLDFWPLLLILIGIMVIWRGFERIHVAGGDGESAFSTIAFLGGTERSCSSPDFRGGEITAFMGGCMVDLRHAVIQADEAVLRVMVFWGGIEIRVPEDWTVSVQAFPILAGLEEKTRPPLEGPRKTLVVRGFVIMGGVEIRN